MPTPTTKPYVVNVRLLEVFPAPPGLVPLYLGEVPEECQIDDELTHLALADVWRADRAQTAPPEHIDPERLIVALVFSAGHAAPLAPNEYQESEEFGRYMGFFPRAQAEALLRKKLARLTAADDANLIVETSPNLSAWTAGAICVGEINHDDGTATVTWRSSQPVATTPRQYLRARFVLR